MGRRKRLGREDKETIRKLKESRRKYFSLWICVSVFVCVLCAFICECVRAGTIAYAIRFNKKTSRKLKEPQEPIMPHKNPSIKESTPLSHPTISSSPNNVWDQNNRWNQKSKQMLLQWHCTKIFQNMNIDFLLVVSWPFSSWYALNPEKNLNKVQEPSAWRPRPEVRAAALGTGRSASLPHQHQYQHWNTNMRCVTMPDGCLNRWSERFSDLNKPSASPEPEVVETKSTNPNLSRPGDHGVLTGKKKVPFEIKSGKVADFYRVNAEIGQTSVPSLPQ